MVASPWGYADMAALAPILAAFAFVCGSLVVFGLFLLTRQVGQIETHLGALRREMTEALRDAVIPRDGSQS